MTPEQPKLCKDCRHFRGARDFQIFFYRTKNFYRFGKCAATHADRFCDVSRQYGPCYEDARLYEAKT